MVSVHLLRHGQFKRREDKNDGPLTAVGRRQARYAAARCRDMSITKIYSSDVERASETAEIILAKLPDISMTALPMLRELIHTAVPGHPIPLESRRLAKERIEMVISRFFTRPPRSGNTLLVCHGNLIRALLCRILGTPVMTWRRIGAFNCGITTVDFGKDGQTYVRCVNDTGHLPHKLRTSG